MYRYRLGHHSVCPSTHVLHTIWEQQWTLLLLRCCAHVDPKRLYPGYIIGFLYMQILHYNNDFEIDKMCLRNWCARETTVTPMHSFPKLIWKLKHIHKPFFSIVTHFPPSFHNWQVQRLLSETDYVTLSGFILNINKRNVMPLEATINQLELIIKFIYALI